jgi:hypothetical protein
MAREMLVAYTNAVKVESVPLNSGQFFENVTSTDDMS